MTSSDDDRPAAGCHRRGGRADRRHLLRRRRRGDRARVAVVCAKFNGGHHRAAPRRGARRPARHHGVDHGLGDVAWVPGAFELPLAAAAPGGVGRRYDAVVALGAVIRGDTAHFDFVAGECAAGLRRVALDTGVPVVFGVLTTDTVAQALERSGTGGDQQGIRGGGHRPGDGPTCCASCRPDSRRLATASE